MIEKGVCRIKFSLTDTLVDHPKEVAILGDFNNWDPRKGRMQRSENGFFEKTIELPLGKDYQFRYLVDNWHWENDWQADAYKSTPFGEDENMILYCDALQTKVNKKQQRHHKALLQFKNQ
jgi:1,4-alpha-glucan branching enzyme